MATQPPKLVRKARQHAPYVTPAAKALLEKLLTAATALLTPVKLVMMAIKSPKAAHLEQAAISVTAPVKAWLSKPTTLLKAMTVPC